MYFELAFDVLPKSDEIVIMKFGHFTRKCTHTFFLSKVGRYRLSWSSTAIVCGKKDIQVN